MLVFRYCKVIKYLFQLYDTMGGIRFCVCGCQSENPFVCFGTKLTQRACTRDLPQDRKDEGKRIWEKREEGSQKGAEGTSRQNRSVREMRVGKRGDQSTKVRKAAARTCWPTDAGWTKARSQVKSALLVVLCFAVKKCEIPKARDEKNRWMNHWQWVV